MFLLRVFFFISFTMSRKKRIFAIDLSTSVFSGNAQATGLDSEKDKNREKSTLI